MKRPSDKDEELEPRLTDPAARARVETLTQRLLSFAETTSKDEDNRRYFFARGHEFAQIFADHGKALVDVRAPRPGSQRDGGTGLRERMHQGAHREGWVLVPLDTDDDIRAAEKMAALAYEEVLGMAPTIAVRKERPLESFASAPRGKGKAPEVKEPKAAPKAKAKAKR
jgi:hypothetical protein